MQQSVRVFDFEHRQPKSKVTVPKAGPKYAAFLNMCSIWVIFSLLLGGLLEKLLEFK